MSPRMQSEAAIPGASQTETARPADRPRPEGRRIAASGRVGPAVRWGWLAFVTLACAAAGCGVPGPDQPVDTFRLDFSMPAGSHVRGAIVFVVDGLNARIFQEMVEADQLPAVKKYFVGRGLYCPRAVGNVPSVTLANETSFVTGLFPGHHGITGINWFDRNHLIWRNYETIAQKNTLDGDYSAGTIYEQFPDETTFSVFFQAHRGVTKFIENWMSAGPPFFFGWYEFIDRLTLSRFNIVMDVARKRRRFPAVTVAYLLAPDFRGYGFGVSSRQYRQAIRHTDRQIGRFLADLDRAGLLEKLHIAIVSDHGMCDVKRHFCLEQFLRRKLRLKTAEARLWEDTPFERRLDYYRKFPAVLYGSGDRYWAICLRQPIRQGARAGAFEPWPVRPNADDLRSYPTGAGTVDLLAALAEQDAVDTVAYAVGRNRVRVRRKTGEAEFRQDAGRGGTVSYHLISGADPFGWKGKVPDEALNGKPMRPRQWLAATNDSEFPDLPAQILAYFRARRAGDLAVFAAPGWDFFSVHRAGHGGLRPGEMHVPLLLAGPGVPRGRIEAARTADLTPTILRLLGRPAPSGLDGRPLVGD